MYHACAMQGWFVYLFCSWHCSVVLDFFFLFYPLHFLSNPFFYVREDDGFQKFGSRAILMASSSSLQEEIMWESCSSVRSCRGDQPHQPPSPPRRRFWGCPGAAPRKFHVPDTICPRKYLTGVLKDLKASQTPWKEKPEGFLLLGFRESPLQAWEKEHRGEEE